MMIQDLLLQQRQTIAHYFDHLDLKKVDEVVNCCLQTKGLILITGVGKSGIIAEKVAMTLISTGTRALHLPPTNFLHGDIGIVSEQDLFIVVSKSGETEELLNLIPFVKKRGAKILAIVSNPHSRLAKLADLSISLPVQKELCPFDLAPTTSTAVQLLFGDLLAIALMRAKKFSLEDYAETHPSGSIGKKLTLTVKDLMKGKEHLPLCKPSDRLANILNELTTKKCGAVLVVDETQHLLGIFTDGDLRRSLQAQGPSAMEKEICSLMTAHPTTIPQHILAWDAMKIMQKDPKKWIMVTPVVENGKVVGILHMHDIISAGIN